MITIQSYVNYQGKSGSGECDIATSSQILKALHVGAVMQFLPRGISAAVRFRLPAGSHE